MDFTPYITQVRYLLPEISLLAAAIVAIMAHLFVTRNSGRIAGLISLIGLVLTMGVLIVSPRSAGAIFSGALTVDNFSFYFKLVLLLSGILTLPLSFKFFGRERSEAGEIYYLLLFAVAGMMFVVSAADLITFYIAYELFAIISYVLAGVFKKDRRSAEAGIKYFILGVLSSAIMLLGMAFLYGITGETNFQALARLLPQADPRIALTGMVLVFTGIFFKLALVPFHMWTPDIYEGAPTPLVVFLSTAPKAAIFAVLLRFTFTSGIFGSFESKWSLLFGAIAVASMFWGNIAGIVQNNIKRMLAYSSIAQAGYLMIGLAAWGELGSMAVMFYLPVYLLMNTAAFAVILLARKSAGWAEHVDDLHGLAGKSPVTSACLIIVLLSLTGIPPTGGFIGKYFLFAAAVGKGLYYLAVAGAVNSVISLFYYFRIGRAMFMEKELVHLHVERIDAAKVVIVLSSALILLAGILPSRLTDFVMGSLLR